VVKSLLHEKLIDTVSSENVTNKEIVMEAYTATAVGRLDRAGALIEKPKKPEFVVMPRSTKEIQEIVRLANEIKVPVIPMGSLTSEYADSVPLEGGIMLDMKKMNHIELDEELMNVTIEPGVTYAQAFRELADKGYCIPNQALPANVSIMGATTQGAPNIPLDHTKFVPYHSSLTIGLEVVLPTGELLITGSAALPGVKPNQARAYGPDVGAIFLAAQGTLGIITRQTLPLHKIPEHRHIVEGDFKDDNFNGLTRTMRRIIEDNLNGMTWSEMIWARYNGQETQEWEFFVVLGGSKERVEFNREFSERIIKEEGGTIKAKSRMLELEWDYSGVPMGFNYEEMIYWRPRANSIVIPPPDVGQCTLIGRGTYDQVLESHDAALEILAKHGVPRRRIRTGFLATREAPRAPTPIFGLSYDYDVHNTKEVEDAKAIMEDWRKFGSARGAHYRLTPTESKRVMPMLGEYYELLKKLKRMLDPNRIMNPGKLMDLDAESR
jgi:FAD/FMN-containing dehydrogenase